MHGQVITMTGPMWLVKDIIRLLGPLHSCIVIAVVGMVSVKGTAGDGGRHHQGDAVS